MLFCRACYQLIQTVQRSATHIGFVLRSFYVAKFLFNISTLTSVSYLEVALKLSITDEVETDTSE